MIKVIDNWYIDADECCFKVGELTTYVDKDGNHKHTLKSPKYVSSVSQALQVVMRAYQRNLVKDNELTLKGAVHALEVLNSEFKELLSAIKEEI